MTNVLGSGGPMRWAASAGGGAPGKYRLAMGIVTVVLVVMAAITIYHSASLEAHATSTRTPFMCVECGYARGYRGIDLRNLPPGATSPSAPAGFRGPSIKCPKCGKLTMVEAMARSSGSTSRSLMNERSIFSLPTGKRLR